jgi:hypothetical protein
MAYLNADIPPLYCKVRTEYLYDMDMAKRGEEDCVVFGVSSITGRALLFHIMLPNGAVFYRLPISAFFNKRFLRSEVPDMSLDSLQLWNCFSYYPSVHRFDFLGGVHGRFRAKDKKFYPGQYLFTVDFAHPESNILNTEHSEIPQEHKCCHILELDNGNYAAQPNNRILWHINSFTTDTTWPDYSVQTTYWECEGPDWVTEDSNKMFYDLEAKK